MYKVLSVIVILAVALLSFSCSEEKMEAKSIEQIYKEEGVPVRIETVKPIPFVVERAYNAVLTGIEESSAYAKVGDKVEKIFVKVGDYVKKDQVLLTFPTDNPNAQYFQAKVAYDNAKLAYERIANMYKSGGISKQQLDNAKASFDVAAANWDAAQQTVIVKAPISGYVTKVNISETDNVKKEAELFTISRMNRMKARVWISEKDSREVKNGMAAYAVWNDIRIEGKVIEVDMALNQQKQAFGALLEFDNPGKILKFGITVDIFIKTYENPQAIVVRMKDMQKDSEGFSVFIIENAKAQKRTVVPGRQFNMDVEIEKGLSVGDMIVVEGQMLLEPNPKIRIVE